MIMRGWMKHEYVTLICTNYLIKFTCQPVSPILTTLGVLVYSSRVRVLSLKHRQILANKLVQAYGHTWEERKKDMVKETEKYVDIVLECCKDETLVRIYNSNSNDARKCIYNNRFMCF